MRGMRLAARVALIAGLGVMILLVAREGALGIGKLLTRAGFALLWLVPLHALPLALDVNAWRTLIAAPVRVLPLYWIGAIRQAVNGLLPVASIGGEIVGIRLLAQRGVAGILAAATVIVEVLLTVVGQ
jgi:hypothetical protein